MLTNNSLVILYPRTSVFKLLVTVVMTRELTKVAIITVYFKP